MTARFQHGKWVDADGNELDLNDPTAPPPADESADDKRESRSTKPDPRKNRKAQ